MGSPGCRSAQGFKWTVTSNGCRVRFSAALGMESAWRWEGPRGSADQYRNAVPMKTMDAGGLLGPMVPEEGLRDSGTQGSYSHVVTAMTGFGRKMTRRIGSGTKGTWRELEETRHKLPGVLSQGSGPEQVAQHSPAATRVPEPFPRGSLNQEARCV